MVPSTCDWANIEHQLRERGHAVLRSILSPEQCRELAGLYEHEERFRSKVIMARHGFGRGEYKYFSYPLPSLLTTLREQLYGHLEPIANRWNEQLGHVHRYPPELAQFLALCHGAGQCRPTPLILRYVEGDYNCLHQDLYGEHVFPIQVAILLSEPGTDFSGGEFVMTERTAEGQIPRVAALNQGDAIAFAVNERPVRGRRGLRKATLRHGVSSIRCGTRYTVGIIFHDAL